MCSTRARNSVSLGEMRVGFVHCLLDSPKLFSPYGGSPIFCAAGMKLDLGLGCLDCFLDCFLDFLACVVNERHVISVGSYTSHATPSLVRYFKTSQSTRRRTSDVRENSRARTRRIKVGIKGTDIGEGEWAGLLLRERSCCILFS